MECDTMEFCFIHTHILDVLTSVFFGVEGKLKAAGAHKGLVSIDSDAQDHTPEDGNLKTLFTFRTSLCHDVFRMALCERLSENKGFARQYLYFITVVCHLYAGYLHCDNGCNCLELVYNMHLLLLNGF
jgi:hypothetical protein